MECDWEVFEFGKDKRNGEKRKMTRNDTKRQKKPKNNQRSFSDFFLKKTPKSYHPPHMKNPDPKTLGTFLFLSCENPKRARPTMALHMRTSYSHHILHLHITVNVTRSNAFFPSPHIEHLPIRSHTKTSTRLVLSTYLLYIQASKRFHHIDTYIKIYLLVRTASQAKQPKER